MDKFYICMSWNSHYVSCFSSLRVFSFFPFFHPFQIYSPTNKIPRKGCGIIENSNYARDSISERWIWGDSRWVFEISIVGFVKGLNPFIDGTLSSNVWLSSRRKSDIQMRKKSYPRDFNGSAFGLLSKRRILNYQKFGVRTNGSYALSSYLNNKLRRLEFSSTSFPGNKSSQRWSQLMHYHSGNVIIPWNRSEHIQRLSHLILRRTWHRLPLNCCTVL